MEVEFILIATLNFKFTNLLLLIIMLSLMEGLSILLLVKILQFKIADFKIILHNLKEVIFSQPFRTSILTL
jgi:hypothetical protein